MDCCLAIAASAVSYPIAPVSRPMAPRSAGRRRSERTAFRLRRVVFDIGCEVGTELGCLVEAGGDAASHDHAVVDVAIAHAGAHDDDLVGCDVDRASASGEGITE